MNTRQIYNLFILLLGLVYVFADVYRRLALRSLQSQSATNVNVTVAQQVVGNSPFSGVQIFIIIAVCIVVLALIITYFRKIHVQGEYRDIVERKLRSLSDFVKRHSSNSVLLSNDYVDVEYYFNEVIIVTSHDKNSSTSSQIIAKAGFLNNHLEAAFVSVCSNFIKTTSYNSVYSILNKHDLNMTYSNIPKITSDFRAATERKKEEHRAKYEKKAKEKQKKTENLDIIEENVKKIDINTASEAEIQELPGINIVLAKKIIKTRHEKGGFTSVDDFIKTMGIKDHFASKIKKMVVVNKIERQSVNNEQKGRIVDI